MVTIAPEVPDDGSRLVTVAKMSLPGLFGEGDMTKVSAFLPDVSVPELREESFLQLAKANNDKIRTGNIFFTVIKISTLN